MKLLIPLLIAAAPALSAASFQEHLIASELKGGYQVVIADLNKDGKPDIIALASGMPDLVWYENPTWERHVIVSGAKHMINVWPLDINGHGIPELLLAHEFSNQAANSIGIVSLLEHQGDPKNVWSMREIDRLTTSHRIRAANGMFINAALTGANATAPDYRDHTPLVAYKPGDWNRRLVTKEDEGVVHGIYITDWNGDGKDDILTASFQGIYVNLFKGEGVWERKKIADGSPLPWPKSGSSDVAVGMLKKERYLAAIEPWHGNEVAVYRERAGAWQRNVIDDSLTDGHTIITADLDGNGALEIIAGFRSGKKSVYIYTEKGKDWQKSILDDGGMGAAACAAADLNGDKRIDIVCIGSATANLKWYENLGGK